MSFLQGIIAKGLAIVDALMSNWANATPINAPEPVTCGYYILNAELEECGTDLVASLAELVARGVDLLNGMLMALGAV